MTTCCWALSYSIGFLICLQTGSADAEEARAIKSRIAAVKSFFQQFEGCEIQFKNEMGATFCVVSSNTSARFIETGVIKNDEGQEVRLVNEVLIQESFQQIVGRQSLFGEGLKKRTKAVLLGELDWRKTDWTNQIRFFWLGFLWNGERFVDSKADDFWKDSTALTDDGHLIVTSPDGSQQRFHFDEHRQRLRLVKVVLKFTDRRQSKLTVPFDLMYTGENKSLSSLTIFGDVNLNGGIAMRDPVVMPIVAIRKKAETVKPLKFKAVNTRNGRKVFVDDSNFRYSYADGVIHKIIDKEAMDVIDGLLAQSGVAPKDRSAMPGVQRANYLRESTRDAHCGPYALCGAAAVLGKRIPIEELIENDELSGLHGASVPALEKAAGKNGLYFKTISRCDFQSLAAQKSPALLHFSATLQSDFTSHWVACLGTTEDGDFRILDLPKRPVAVSPAVLMASWDGTAIILDKNPISRWKYLLTRKWMLFYVFGLVAFSVVGVSHARKLWTPKRYRTALDCGLILLTTALLSLIWTVSSSVSFAKNPMAVGLTKSKLGVAQNSGKIQNITSLPIDESKFLIVDCREPHAFIAGHIPSAVNLPISATSIDIGEFAERFSEFRKEAVVVYCQSDQCKWASRTANLLATLGFNNVSVYEPGWKGFQRQ